MKTFLILILSTSLFLTATLFAHTVDEVQTTIQGLERQRKELIEKNKSGNYSVQIKELEILIQGQKDLLVRVKKGLH